jgi:putative tricarboxylic transport membrane protein
MQRLLRTGDFWAGLVFAALGAYIVSEARGWVYLGEEGPGAGFFPMWYGIAMLALSPALVVGAAMKTRRRTPTTATDPVAGHGVRPQGAGRALACWAALAVCVAMLKWAGFIVSFALLSWFIVAILCRKRAVVALAVSVGWAMFFWLVFSWGLDMNLPAGRLF